MKKIMAAMPGVEEIPGWEADEASPTLDDDQRALFRVGQSISGYDAVGGNQARLMADSNAAIDTMIEDIDAATDHVHLLFYIWMPDNNGRKDGRGAQARGSPGRHLSRYGR